MATRQNKEESKADKPVSYKEEILTKIRLEEQRRQDGPPAGPLPPPPSAGAPASRTHKPATRSWKSSGLFGPGVREMAVYARQMAMLVEVGIPLLRAIQIMAQRSNMPRLRRVSRDLARRVEEGQPLSSAMMSHPNVFSPMFVSMVRTGEAGGILDESLRRLADLLERRSDLRRRIIGAFMYPLVALVIELLVVAVILVWAFPRLIAAYPTQEDLPAVTRVLIGVSNWVIDWWWALGLGAIGLGLLLVLLRSIPTTRFWLEKTVLVMPLFGDINRKINVARFSRTLGNLVSAGIPLIDALAISAETSDNEVVERTLMRVHKTVETGGKMEDPMRSEPVFDPVVVDMVMVGDESGALDTMLLKIADIYDQEVSHTLRTLTAILEPLLIVLLGCAVGFLAIAVFLPYIRLVQSKSLMPE